MAKNKKITINEKLDFILEKLNKNEKNKLWLGVELKDIVIIVTSVYVGSWFSYAFKDYMGLSIISIILVIFGIFATTAIIYTFFYLIGKWSKIVDK